MVLWPISHVYFFDSPCISKIHHAGAVDTVYVHLYCSVCSLANQFVDLKNIFIYVTSYSNNFRVTDFQFELKIIMTVQLLIVMFV